MRATDAAVACRGGHQTRLQGDHPTPPQLPQILKQGRRVDTHLGVSQQPCGFPHQLLQPGQHKWLQVTSCGGTHTRHHHDCVPVAQLKHPKGSHKWKQSHCVGRWSLPQTISQVGTLSQRNSVTQTSQMTLSPLIPTMTFQIIKTAKNFPRGTKIIDSSPASHAENTCQT